jgi:hypothetical protein
MRDYDHETKKDGARGQPPQKSKTGGEQDPAHKHADGHAPAHPDILRDEHLAHPANAEPLAELLSQLQHTHGNAYVQRAVAEAGGEKSHEPKPAAESHTHGGEQSLDAGTRSRMESAFGESFGDVRVHTGQHAGEASDELGARAFTRGRDIYFNEGEYNPSTREGQELLAHELTHVVQQRGGSSAHGSSAGRAGDTFEREADDVAASVVRGERAHVEGRSAAPAFQQKGKESSPKIVDGGTHPVAEVMYFHLDGDVEVHGFFIKRESGDTLHLVTQADVSVTVVDLTGMNIRVGNIGGPGMRAVTITVPHHRKGPGLVRLTLTRGDYVITATLMFPPTMA